MKHVGGVNPSDMVSDGINQPENAMTPIEIAAAGTRWRMMWAAAALAAAKAKAEAALAAAKAKAKSN